MVPRQAIAEERSQETEGVVMRRVIQITIAAAVIAALVPGTTVAYASAAYTGRDLVSPDARDSARHLASSSSTLDLRSPDARDVASRGVATYTPGHVPQFSQAPAPVLQAPVRGFDWGDAGIGAAGMLALIALAAGTMLIASQRRRDHRFPVATR
jgi:hypothetical protein